MERSWGAQCPEIPGGGTIGAVPRYAHAADPRRLRSTTGDGYAAHTRIPCTPFDLVPDPEKKIFRAYGVERGLRGLISPTVMREYVKALAAGFSPGLLTSDGGLTGNPTDFLIDASGRVVFAHYGKHYADSLEAAHVVGAWRSAQHKAPAPNADHVIPSERQRVEESPSPRPRAQAPLPG